MSIVAVHLRPTEAHIMVDTLGFTSAGVAAFGTSKALTIPHMRAALAIRGAVDPFYDVFLNLLRGGYAGIDDAAADLPALWKTAYADYLRNYADAVAVDDVAAGVEFFMVGYSQKSRTMRGFYMKWLNDFAVEEIVMGDVFMAPLLGDAGLQEFKSSVRKRIRVPQDFLRLARLQHAQIAAESAMRPAGELTLVTVSPRATETRRIGSLPAPAGVPVAAMPKEAPAHEPA